MGHSKETDVPCETCILLAVCLDPDRFSDTFYGCKCYILEDFIGQNMKDDTHLPRQYAVVDWYKEKTGYEI